LLRPEKLIIGILILLFLGLFNLMSFAYFINVVLTFGFSILVTPGIQLFSLILLGFLVVRRRKELINIYHKEFGQTEEEIQQSKIESKNSFKNNFYSLSDYEIELRLKENIVPEAKQALIEIMEERNNALQQKI